MNDSPSSAENADPRIQAALTEFLERVDRGENPDREEFLTQHLEIADQLRSFIEAAERLGHLAEAGRLPERTDESTQSFALRGQETVAPQGQWKQGPVAKDGSALGKEFGRYRIVRALGHGAMGTVYLAEDTQLLRQVALKTPQFGQEPTPELLARFYREARAAATLQHPNICPVYDVGQIEGTHYISMAYIEGHPLSAFIRSSKPQPERQILIVIRKLALALQEAHDHGIVHRDLKPANIMLNKRNEPIVMDFGLAQQARREDDIRITQHGSLIGTPAYMSPEQVDGQLEKIGPATDQYSLGVILYELLTGHLPFRGSIASVMGQIVTRAATPPGQLRPGLDPRTDAACLKMLAKQPGDRFASLSAVGEELTTILRMPGAKPTIIPAEDPSGTGRLTPSGTQLESAAGEKPLESSTAPPSGAVPKKVLTANDVASLEELSRKCLARRDYEQVIQIVERIPQEQRSAGLVTLLEKSRAKADEIAFLTCEIDEAVRFNDGLTALQKADELLAIKPGHHRALEMQQQFGGFAEGGAARTGSRWKLTERWDQGGWIPWSVLAFGLAVFCAMTGLIVIYLNRTAVLIDVKDPGVEVTVKGKDITITGPKMEKVVVRPGDQVLTIRYNGLETVTRAFTLSKGQTRKVTVSIVDSRIAAELENKPLDFAGGAPKAPDGKGPGGKGAQGNGPEGKVQAGRAVATKQPAAQEPSGAATNHSLAMAKPKPEGRRAASPLAAKKVSRDLLNAPFDATAAAQARQAWADFLNLPAELTNSVGMKLVLIPPGRFPMGSPEAEPGHRYDEAQVSVTITRPFWLGECEVSQAQWQSVTHQTPWVGKSDTQVGDNYPASFIDWVDAVDFCKKLTKIERQAGRLPADYEYALPTEAQWEYACRAGSTDRFPWGSDESRLAQYAWFSSNTGGQRAVHEIGKKKPNAGGLYDMQGNAWEWCRDRYAAQLPGGEDPEVSTGGEARSMRGGCVDRPARDCRCASRGYDTRFARNALLGLRVALVASGQVGTKLAASSSKATDSGNRAAKDRGVLTEPFDELAAKKAQQEWAQRLKSPVELANSMSMTLRLIPPGRFQMGSDDSLPFVRPAHRVQITRPFYLGVYEVTRGQFSKFAAAAHFKTKAERDLGGYKPDNTEKRAKWEAKRRYTWHHPGFAQDDSHPVINVTWDDARAFCDWLSRKERKSYRLPTEAEWEYACRAGTTTWYYSGDSYDDATQIGNIPDASSTAKFPKWQAAAKSSDGFVYTSPVGQFRPNNFGLYDMAGNAFEWCSDWFDMNYYSHSPESDPPGPSSGRERVTRGGSFARLGASFGRLYVRPEQHMFDFGFRVLCEIPAESTATDTSGKK